VEYRQLGRSGLRVSVFSFGTTSWHGHPEIGTSDLAGAKRQVAMALEAGINLFDTADRYGFGKCEEYLAEALGSRRADVLIATKVHNRMSDVPTSGGLSRKHLISACEASLRRLKTDYIDLYQMHGWDGVTPLEETLSTLDDLVKAGKVRYIGTSNYSAWHLMKALAISTTNGTAPFVAQQIYCSLHAREAEYELVPVALDQGVGILTWSPLAGGLLSGKWRRGQEPHAVSKRLAGWPDPPIYREAELWDIVDVLLQIASDREASAAQVALAYLAGKPGVCSVIIGARTDEQLADNLQGSSLELSEDERRRLDDVSAPDLLYPYWHQAKYNDRLGDADLALLGRYREIPEVIHEGSAHRPLPGFGLIPGSTEPHIRDPSDL
jgi:aryl-alcohol dehydrogenase-like predicted oxidoreductase